jgi:manganese/zinc/iron transport system permease protein
MLGASWIAYFTDPVLRAPTIACMLMCLGASLVGVVVILRKQALLGESLSHAAYPGVIGGVLISAAFSETVGPGLVFVCILFGAFVSALLGLWLIDYLEKKQNLRSDSSLCFVLSAFFGVGITGASAIQVTHTQLYLQAQVYLYGQAATMLDFHIYLYAVLAFLILVLVLVFYKELLVMSFDQDYAGSLGIPTRWINRLLFALIVLAIVVGIRSVGVVLMSAMLIAPAVAARQYTHRLSNMFALSATFGVFSGFLGNVLSVELSYYLQKTSQYQRISIPTGPAIVVVATAICLFSLFFARERGLIPRLWRITLFHHRCICENLLKGLWKRGKAVTAIELAAYQGIPRRKVQLALWNLQRQAWVRKETGGAFTLTDRGRVWAERIVRLHRLWELYLADCLGVGVERVHRSAEEMEHIITPEMEEKLTQLLNDPKEDPHHQLIPPRTRLT